MNGTKVPAFFMGAMLILSAAGPAIAATESSPSPQQAEPSHDEENKNELLRKLQSNEPSYLVAARDNNDSFSHIEFYLSVKYPLLERVMNPLFNGRAGLYFNYNGKYDFYLNSRYSSPVISRRQNPGLMFEYKPVNIYFGLNSIKTGYFHESNGQTIDTEAEYATTEYAADFVSRGWDYIPLELKFKFPKLHEGFSFYFKGRYFLPKQLFNADKEDEIFWEKGNDAKIEDYDGLSFVFSQTLPVNANIEGLKFTAIYRTGYCDFNLSQRYEVTARVYDIPFYIFYFSGYGIEISTYQERGYTWGIGFEMW